MGVEFILSECSASEAGDASMLRPTEPEPQQSLMFQSFPVDGPLSAESGSIMTLNGSCYRCPNCGSTSGCS